MTFINKKIYPSAQIRTSIKVRWKLAAHSTRHHDAYITNEAKLHLKRSTSMFSRAVYISFGKSKVFDASPPPAFSWSVCSC